MGIFNNYTKPGKGVDVNAPRKRGVFLYFEIITQKFGRLMGANCLYSLTSIIYLILLFFLGALVIEQAGIAQSISTQIAATGQGGSAEDIQASVTLMLRCLFAVSVFLLWGSGPSSAAYAYINRCFTRDEHVWVMSDGKDKFVENFKQGMVVVVIDAAVLFFGINAMMFYHSYYAATHSLVWMLLTYVLGLVFVICTMMHSFIYQIMVTFECSIGAVYKNALLITLAKLPGSAAVTAVSALVIFLAYAFLHPLFATIVMLTIGLCLTRYVTDFYAARVIERNILKKLSAKQDKRPVIEYIGEEDE